MEDGIWLTILEYANYREISVSTIRRYIKDNRVKTKKDDGKYLIWVNQENYSKRAGNERELLELKFETQRLADRVKLLEEENNDLKMLVNIYESKPEIHEQLPQLPI